MNLKKTFLILENINKKLNEAQNKNPWANVDPSAKTNLAATGEALPFQPKNPAELEKLDKAVLGDVPVKKIKGENLPEVPDIKPLKKGAELPPEITKQRLTYAPKQEPKEHDPYAETVDFLNSLKPDLRMRYISSLKTAPQKDKDHYANVALYGDGLHNSIRDALWKHTMPMPAGYDINKEMEKYIDMLKSGK